MSRSKSLYILSRPVYKNILVFLLEFHEDRKKKITIEHFKYLLLKGYKETMLPRLEEEERRELMEVFSISPFNKNKLRELWEEYRRGEIDKDTYDQVSTILRKNLLSTLEKRGLYDRDVYVTSVVNLRKYLRNLREMGLIERHERKHKKPYYRLTNLGLSYILRYLLHESIDKLIPPSDTRMLYTLHLMILQHTAYKLKIGSFDTTKRGYP